MGSRSNPLRTLAWLALVLLSLRPVGHIETLAGVAASPLRLVAALTPPVRWLRPKAVRAAEGVIATHAESEAVEGDQLRRDLGDSAEPSRPELRAGRRLVRGEVLRRDVGALDRLWIQLGSGAEWVEPGCAVVCGDAYVGRIGELDRSTSRARVDLITGRDVFVGARLVPDSPSGAQQRAAVRMTVGGVARVPGAARRNAWTRVWLDIHNPSERDFGLGNVLVDELESGEFDALGVLAEGYSLGRLVEPPSDSLSEEPLLVPDLDYAHGLFQVVVLALEDGGPDLPEPVGPALEDGRWLPVRSLGGGDPSPWRRGAKLSRGVESGIVVGAAVVSGARLLGRVTSVGWGSAEVALLGDPGLELVAVARVEGLADPQVLGRLIGVGVPPGAPPGVFDFECDPRKDVASAVVEAGGATGVRLFTGAGERGLPSGLWVGQGRVIAPKGGSADGVGRERHRVQLESSISAHDVRDLWVRIESEGGAAR